MDKATLSERIKKIEEEISHLKEEIEPQKGSSLSQRVNNLVKLTRANWVLISFLIAISTALYVKFVYGIEYFEDYKNKATSKKVSVYYQELGDKMMAHTKLDAALDAYKTALEFNPNNMQATYGVLKTRIFEPQKDEKYYDPEIADAKLDFLSTLLHDDRDILFLKAYNYQNKNDIDNALLYFEKTKKKDSTFIGSYLSIANMFMGYYDEKRDSNLFDFNRAARELHHAIRIDSNDASVNANLGYLYIIKGDFKKAIPYLRKAITQSPNLFSIIALGDAYRFSGDLTTAFYWDNFARSVTDNPDDQKERYIAGLWTWNFMPLYAHDTATIKYYIFVDTYSDKRSLIHYALSIDYAIAGNYEQANKEFTEASQLDPDKNYESFINNKIQSTVYFLNLNVEAKEWTDQHVTSAPPQIPINEEEYDDASPNTGTNKTPLKISSDDNSQRIENKNKFVAAKLEGTWINHTNKARWEISQSGNQISFDVYKSKGKKKGQGSGIIQDGYVQVIYNDFTFDVYKGNLFFSVDRKILQGTLTASSGFQMQFTLSKD